MSAPKSTKAKAKDLKMGSFKSSAGDAMDLNASLAKSSKKGYAPQTQQAFDNVYKTENYQFGNSMKSAGESIVSNSIMNSDQKKQIY